MNELHEIETRRIEEVRFGSDEPQHAAFEEQPHDELPFYIPRD